MNSVRVRVCVCDAAMPVPGFRSVDDTTGCYYAKAMTMTFTAPDFDIARQRPDAMTGDAHLCRDCTVMWTQS